MLIWVIVIIVTVWWISKYLNSTKSSSKTEDSNTTKKEISEDTVFEIQNNFERRLKEVHLPDVIGGKEIYIYKNLMRVWYKRLSSENRYKDAMIQKLMSDWLEYINALDNLASYLYLSLEAASKEKQESYYNDHILASKKAFAIEDAFASAIGKDAVKELDHIRGLSAFNFNGELAPDGFEWDAEQKLRPIK
jgi:hypothetical protein